MEAEGARRPLLTDLLAYLGAEITGCTPSTQPCPPEPGLQRCGPVHPGKPKAEGNQKLLSTWWADGGHARARTHTPMTVARECTPLSVRLLRVHLRRYRSPCRAAMHKHSLFAPALGAHLVAKRRSFWTCEAAHEVWWRDELGT